MDSYDRYAAEWTGEMRSGKVFSRSYIEKPAMRAKLPNLHDKTVLCVGCGSGDECKELADRGAIVTGIDNSSALIRIAQESYPDVHFCMMDMENIKLPEASFDFVYSSLTLHYKRNWARTLAGIHRVMKPGATFLFSANHPVAWSAETISDDDRKQRLLGYEQLGANITFRGDYLATRIVHDRWFGYFEVSFFTKPLSEAMREIRAAAFELVDFLEPRAIAEGMNVNPIQYARYQRIPLFMIFELAKPLIGKPGTEPCRCNLVAP
jgi:SAM-dependent methyltransferase